MDNKIVILGSFNTGALEHSFSRGFSAIGYQVISFDIPEKIFADLNSIRTKILYRLNISSIYKKVNEDILLFCKEHRPKFIFVCKGITIYPSTIVELKKFSQLIVNYNPDHPFKFYSVGSGNDLIKESVCHYDILFTYSKSIATHLNKNNLVLSYRIPFGYDDSNLRSCTSNISLDFLFVGTCDKQRIEFIKAINRPDIKVFGDQKWFSKFKPGSIVKQCYQGRPLFGEELSYMTASATATINFLRPQNMKEDSHNMRTFEIPAMRGLQLSAFTNEQAELFESEKEILFYHSIEELKDKMNFVLAHPNYAMQIRQGGHLRCIKSNYSYKNRCAEMMCLMEQHV
jgi:spore maturation protein CgeB